MLQKQLAFLQENQFDHSKVLPWDQIPPEDAPFVQVWQEYIGEIPQLGALTALSQRLVQLQFPVEEGMSANPHYLLATRKGIPTTTMKVATGTKLEQPANLKVYLHQTYGGRIPVIETHNRNDFETLVRVFSYRNEPVKIPASMGACLIKGYNNWDRVARYKNTTENFDFNQMKSQKELYQDTFIILNNNFYSGVPSAMLGLADEQWSKLSMLIRREHEATHYFTLRFLGSAQNHLLDEFIADYMGIVAAHGRYRADLFIHFMGGRLTNYLKDMKLSNEALEQVMALIKKAAINVEELAGKYGGDVYSEKGKYEMLLKLAKTNLTVLASNNAEQVLFNKNN